jgi:hypothetical protein
MTDTTFTLFDDFAARFARGETPDVRFYLERAGEGRDELADLIDVFLAHAEPGEPDEEAVAVMRALVDDRPPLLELRTRRGIRVDAIVKSLVTGLGIEPHKDAKVKDYYQQLEGGLLDAGRVDRRVWDVLASQLGEAVRDLAGWRPRVTPLRMAYARQVRVDRGLAAGAFAADRAADAVRPPEEDEVDRLFTGANRPPAPGA